LSAPVCSVLIMLSVKPWRVVMMLRLAARVWVLVRSAVMAVSILAESAVMAEADCQLLLPVPRQP